MSFLHVDSALFVGIGGGNDVFSTWLAAASLWNAGWRWRRCGYAGVLSPFHRHTVESADALGAFRTTPASQRFLLRRDDPRQIGFIDARVAEFVESHGPYRSTEVLGLSLEGGSVGLSRTFAKLAERYALIVLVDLGGDCFFSGATDRHVLSPMFDALCLRAFIDSGVRGVLFEAGPGTDGELDPESLRRALEECRADAFPLDDVVVGRFDILYQAWIAKQRPGRTVPMTIEAYRSAAPEIVLQYRARAHLGVVRKYALFDQRINTALCQSYYLVQPDRIRNPFAVACESPLEWFEKAQGLMRTNNEANLEYLPLEDGRLGQFLTPSPLFVKPTRRELIDLGLKDLEGGVCDLVWMFPDDWERVTDRDRFACVPRPGGTLVEVMRKVEGETK